MHDSSKYGYSVTILRTTAGSDVGPAGYGIAFTLGAGEKIISSLAKTLASPLIGQTVRSIFENLGDWQKKIADHPQWRWLGPHKGVVSLAQAGIVNALWDLYSKTVHMPLWKALGALSPDEIVCSLDLSGLEDVLTGEDAAALLAGTYSPKSGAGAASGGAGEGTSAKMTEASTSSSDRFKELEGLGGFPGYDTSFGWISFPDEKIRQGARDAKAAGFGALKLKVGSPDPKRDLRRVQIVREEVGESGRLMVDVNQQWTTSLALEMGAELAKLGVFWIEEPCHPDDVEAHVTLRKSLEGTGTLVAAGEAIPNRVVFKNYMQRGALDVVQLDPTRQAGVSECIAIAILCKKLQLDAAANGGLTLDGVKPPQHVTFHVGCMGQLAQHLSIFNRVNLGLPLLFCEHIPHLSAYFKYPAAVDKAVYKLPADEGASTELNTDEEIAAAQDKVEK